MSDQHHGRVRELDKQKQPDDDQHTSASSETQISYRALLNTVLVPEGTPGSGDKIMSEEAGAERTSQGRDTHDADSLADAPATDTDIKVNLTQMARQSAIAHTPTLRRSIATRAAKKHRFRSKSRDWWKKIATEDQSTRCSRLQWRRAWRKWMKSLRVTDEEASKEETFNVLADAYTLSDEVRDLFLKGPMENLQDFRY